MILNKQQLYPNLANYLAIELLERLYIYEPTQIQVTRAEVLLKRILPLVTDKDMQNIFENGSDWTRDFFRKYLSVKIINQTTSFKSVKE